MKIENVNNQAITSFGLLSVIFFGVHLYKRVNNITDAIFYDFINQYKFIILLLLSILMIMIFSIFLIFNLGKAIWPNHRLNYTQISGKSIEEFNYVSSDQLEKYILNLKLSGRSINKDAQQWGNTFKVNFHTKSGNRDIYIGSGWSCHIGPGDVVEFNGVNYLALASVHTTEYSITQIYKVLLIEI